ncbi:MAG: nucleoside phosphorylase [Bacteroidales bacterium]|nr:nucleoside phosphorylase [Bacteroidales bacterium]
MKKRRLTNAELVLTEDQRIYHLNLRPDEIGDTIFLFGDPGRVQIMSSLFDSVDVAIENREFVTHTGFCNGKKVTALSTGIGTDNMDIVVNELDALANIDFAKREVKDSLRKLNFVRIGTSGALQKEILPGSAIISSVAGGLDNLLYYYKEMNNVVDNRIADEFSSHMQWPQKNSQPYFIHASAALCAKLEDKRYFRGITLSAPGFYGPQGRSLRMNAFDSAYISKISRFKSNGYTVNNFEMEASALYGLSSILGHNALTVCIALANRITGEFVTDYKLLMKGLLEEILKKITADE